MSEEQKPFDLPRLKNLMLLRASETTGSAGLPLIVGFPGVLGWSPVGLMEPLVGDVWACRWPDE